MTAKHLTHTFTFPLFNKMLIYSASYYLFKVVVMVVDKVVTIVVDKVVTMVVICYNKILGVSLKLH